ncbi:hypothetical protein HDV01_007795 [Terramyces sp. JEL0728]|nr:hypothetical protein HDV01_007795 [Terramyces sp. JEL0728]
MRRNRILKYLLFCSIPLVILYTLRFKQEPWATHELYTELKQEFQHVKQNILKEPIPTYNGNGIVMTLTDKSINLTILYLNHLQNHLKTELPIQVFYNQDEFTKFDLLNVEYQEFKTEGYLFQKGSSSIKPFYYKNLAILQSRFENVLFLDQDNLVLRKPDFIFDSPEFKSTGMIVWKDNFINKCSTPLYKILDLPCHFEFEKESGQFLVNKSIHYHSLRLSTYLTQHDRYQQDKRMLYGDKDTFHLSADTLGLKYQTIPSAITQVGDYNNGMCGYAMLQRWFDDQPLFLHTNGLKGRKSCAKLDYYSVPIFYLGGMDFDYGGEKGYELLLEKVYSPTKNVKVSKEEILVDLDDQSPLFDMEKSEPIDLTVDQLKSIQDESSMVQSQLDSQTELPLDSIHVQEESQLEEIKAGQDLELITQEQSEWVQENRWDTESVIFESTPSDFKAVDDLYFAIKNQLKSYSLELRQEQSRNSEKEITIHKLRESIKKLDSDLCSMKQANQFDIQKLKLQLEELQGELLVEEMANELLSNTLVSSVVFECNSRIASLGPALKEIEYLKTLELKLTGQINELQSRVTSNEDLENEYLKLKSQLETEISKNSALQKHEIQQSELHELLQQKNLEIQVLEKVISDLETKNAEKQKEFYALNESNTTFSARAIQLSGELESIRLEIHSLQNEKEKNELQVEGMQKEIYNYESNKALLEQHLEELEARCESLQSESNGSQLKLTQSELDINLKVDEVNSIKEQLDTSLAMITEYEQEIVLKNQHIEKLNESARQLESSKNSSKSDLDQLMNEKADIARQLQDLQSQFTKEQIASRETAKQLEDRLLEVSQLQSENEQFKQTISGLDDAMKSTEQQAANAKEEQRQQLNSLILVKDGLEKKVIMQSAENEQLASAASILESELETVNLQLVNAANEKEEISSAINQLKQELEQANDIKEKYKQLMKEFDANVIKYQDLEDNHQSLLGFKVKYESLASEFASLQEKNSELEKLGSFKQKYDDLNVQYQEASSQLELLSGFQQKYDDLKIEYASSIETNALLQKEMESTVDPQKNYDDLASKWNEQNEINVQKEKEIEEARVLLQDLKSQIDQLTGECSAQTDKCSELEKETKVRKAELEEYEAKHSSLSEERNLLLEKYATLEKEHSSQLLSLHELQSQIETFKTNNKESEKEKCRITAELQSKLELVAQLEQTSNAPELEEKLKQLSSEIRGLSDRNITLQSEKSNLEYESSLKDSEIIQLKNEKSQLNSSISEKDELSLKNNELVANHQSLKESIDYLEKEKLKYMETIKFIEQEQNSTNDLLEKEMQKSADYESKLESLHSQIEQMKEQINNVESLEKQLNAMKETGELLKQTVHDTESKIAELERQVESKQDLESTVSKLNIEIDVLKSTDESYKKDINKLQGQLQQFQQEYTKVAGQNKALQNEKEKADTQVTLQSSELDMLKSQKEELEKNNAKYAAIVQEYTKQHEKLQESSKTLKQLEALKIQNLELAKTVQSQRNVITNINAELSQVKLASQKAAKRKVQPKMVAIPELDTPKKNDENAEQSADSQEKKKKPKRRRESILLDANNEQQDEEEEESTPMKRKSAEPEETPESQRKTRSRSRGNVYILLSGFKENTQFNGKLRQSLTGVEIIKETEGKAIFDRPHVICPPNTRTLKILAASLSGAWIINDPEWLITSNSRNKLMDESAYGFKSSSNPLHEKKIFKSKSFNDLVAENKGTAYAQYPKFLDVLLRKVSGGQFVDDADEADFVMVADNDST